jgi:hypothetical protein
VERAANDAVDDALLVLVDNGYSPGVKGLATAFDVEPVLCVNLIDKPLQQAISCHADPVRLTNPYMMDIVD